MTTKRTFQVKKFFLGEIAEFPYFKYVFMVSVN